MAKKRISPELFRAGITQNWSTVVKLDNYAPAVREITALQQEISEYWLNRNARKLLIKFSKRKKSRKRKWLRTKKYFNILQKTSQYRRRLLFFQVRLANRSMFFKRKKWNRGLFFNPRYWYRSKQKKKTERRKLFRRLRVHNYRFQKKRVWFRNFFLSNTLELQSYVKNFLTISWNDTRKSVGGSTALRRYQFHLLSIRPPQWTSYIHLKTASFKKMVGSVLTRSYRQFYGFNYLIFLSQLNLALHWRSSYLFALLVKTLLEQRKRVQGALRMLHEILMRLYLARYNITCVKFMVTGSFGKLTRSKSMRLGRIGKETTHSLTALTQSVSYASTQIWTQRGVLGLRVWIFW